LLTDPNNHQAGYFRTSINDAWYGEMIAQFAYQKLNVRRMATIQGEDNFSTAIQQAACTTFQNLGGSCVMQEIVPIGTKDLTALMTKITQAAPDAIFLPIFEPEADEIIMKVRATPGLGSVALLGVDSFYNKEVAAITNGAANGMYLSSLILVENGDLAKRYGEKYGEPLTGDGTALAYDATMLFLNAVNVVAYPVDGILYIPRQAIRDTLHAVQNYNGKSGTLTCDVYGDCADRSRMQILQIQDGQMVRMYP
jgi:branched-chain amino acid transport system substrate-binding protein